eukprot:1194276-Prorocentrum_minimum.AAC.1
MWETRIAPSSLIGVLAGTTSSLAYRTPSYTYAAFSESRCRGPTRRLHLPNKPVTFRRAGRGHVWSSSGAAGGGHHARARGPL